jgi:hypothetical protein
VTKEELSRRADAITARILYSDEPWVDVDIAIANLRDEVEPDRAWLFDAVYVARWERLRAQAWARQPFGR